MASKRPSLPESSEIVIIGAGLIGSALAMSLGDLGASGVVVIDPDLEGTFSSSELNAGGVRATFSQDLNILCSKLSIEYFAQHAAEVGYRAAGYLWIHRPEGMELGLKALPKWEKHHWPVEAWDVGRLQEYAPFVDRTDDLAGAFFGPKDGLLNPNLLKLHYRERAKAKGVRFIDRHALRSSEASENGIDLVFQVLPESISSQEKQGLLSSDLSLGMDGVESARIRAKRVVNCSGAWASDVARMLGYSSPSYSVRRQISLFDCREVDLSPYGLIVDPSGVYFHPEATFMLGGIAERNTPRGHDFSYGGEDFFQEKIWMPLSERSSKFEALRHISGWGGLYEVSPDESAIIGEVAVGSMKGKGRIYESHSYSGHGVMHSYACGRALAEDLVHGRPELFDLAAFSASRFEGDGSRLMPETAVI
jgi:sarcosine oxidase subunit beta